MDFITLMGPTWRLCILCYDIEQRTLLEFPSLPGLVVLPLTWPRVDYLVADVGWVTP